MFRIMSFIRFLGEVTARQICFEINWPLEKDKSQIMNHSFHFQVLRKSGFTQLYDEGSPASWILL